MNTIEKAVEKLEKRLIYLNREIAFERADFNDRIHHDHYAGSLQRMDGTLGEKKFVEDMLELLGEANAQ